MMNGQDIIALAVVFAAAAYVAYRGWALAHAKRSACNCGSKRGCERMNETLRASSTAKRVH